MIKGSSSLCLPANKTWVSVGFSKNHTAEDFGWLSKYPASKNQDLVAVSDGEIIAHHNYSDGGNTVVLGWNYGSHDYYALYMHNKAQSPLKVGTVVKQGDTIAQMGKTGISRGEHVHLVLIKAPKGSKYDNNALRKYRIAPSSYPMYVYPNQEYRGGKVDIKPLPKPTPQPIGRLKVGDTVSYTGNVYATSGGQGKGARVSGKFKVTILNNNAYGVHLDNVGWVKRSDVDASASTPQNKPQQVVSNIGKTAQLRGKVNLYPNSTGGTRYIPSGRSRDLKILDEANGRLKVKSTAFDPQTVWVNKKDVKVV